LHPCTLEPESTPELGRSALPQKADQCRASRDRRTLPVSASLNPVLQVAHLNTQDGHRLESRLACPPYGNRSIKPLASLLSTPFSSRLNKNDFHSEYPVKASCAERTGSPGVSIPRWTHVVHSRKGGRDPRNGISGNQRRGVYAIVKGLSRGNDGKMRGTLLSGRGNFPPLPLGEGLRVRAEHSAASPSPPAPLPEGEGSNHFCLLHQTRQRATAASRSPKLALVSGP
jgi:hypothetical protein